jgi:hypothetical protein
LSSGLAGRDGSGSPEGFKEIHRLDVEVTKAGKRRRQQKELFDGSHVDT